MQTAITRLRWDWSAIRASLIPDSDIFIPPNRSHTQQTIAPTIHPMISFPLKALIQLGIDSANLLPGNRGGVGHYGRRNNPLPRPPCGESMAVKASLPRFFLSQLEYTFPPPLVVVVLFKSKCKF